MTPSRRSGSIAALPADSLAYALQHAAALVQAVLEGQNLTGTYEAALRANSGWPDATRGAVRDLAWGTLRDYGRGDAVLRHYLRKPLPIAIHALLLVVLHRIERRPGQEFTLVDQAVRAAACLAPGLRGVVNGVLRNRLREAPMVSGLLDADEAARFRYPDWWVGRVRRSLPDVWAEVLAAGNQHPPMALRVNRRRASVEAMEVELRAAGHEPRRVANDALVLAKPISVAHLPGFAEGRVSVQDAGAQWAARWLDLAAGQRVLDACAAPGGKAAHILESAPVELLALELDPLRMKRINDNFARLGLAGRTLAADCRDLGSWWDGRPFDRILADVPCSASGVVRRHPDIKWLRRADDIARFATQQAEILAALWQTLAPGGKMLYVTCSVFDEENGSQLARFCAGRRDLQRLEIDGRMEQLLLPDADHDGFFYALLAKRS